MIVLICLLVAVIVVGFGLIIAAMNRQMAELRHEMKNDAALGLIKQDLRGSRYAE
jgi:hypothetical protein